MVSHCITNDSTNSAAEAAQAVKAVESFKSGSDDKNWYRLLHKSDDFNSSSIERMRFLSGVSGAGSLNSTLGHLIITTVKVPCVEAALASKFGPCLSRKVG